jgi:Isocitrate lyase
MYPDQSLYAYDSVPTMVRRINNTFKRADEIQWSRGINPGDKDSSTTSCPSWPMPKPASVAC